MTVGENIRYYRKLNNMTLEELGSKIGVTRQTVSRYENNKIQIPSDTVEAIAEVFNISPADLMGWEQKSPTLPSEGVNIENIISMPKMSKIPLVGTIACGAPILAEQNIEGEVSLPEHIHADFALRCRGDSMINARIFDGDIVYIRKQDTVDDGEIAAVCVDDEATLKRVRLFDDHIVLEPANPMYEPLAYWREDMNNIRILGKAVAFTSVVR